MRKIERERTSFVCKLRSFSLAVFLPCLLTNLPLHAQVNLQTGSATFSLPIFNWQDSKSRLASSIALFYNSGQGLKVDDIASSVGQGWNLMAGGVISRMQVGQPDDQKPYEGTGDLDPERYPAGYLYNNVSAAAGCPMNLTKYPLFGEQNKVYKEPNAFTADREQDYFSLQFGGRTLTFILNKNNGDKGVSLGDSKVKIWYTRDENMPNIRTTINAFYVQDENGLIYKFEKHGLTKVAVLHPCFYDLTRRSSVPYVDRGVYHQTYFDDTQVNPWVINHWYLTEIQDPLTSRAVTFEYETRNLTILGTPFINACQNAKTAFIPAADIWYILVTYQRSYEQAQAISAINYPDGYKTEFAYNKKSPRVDLEGDFPLNGITVRYNDRVASGFQLKTSYFVLNTIKTPTSGYDKKASRLCLTSIQHLSADNKDIESPYSFDYYLGSGVNGDFVPEAFALKRDIFGYYNGRRSDEQNISRPIPDYAPEYASDVFLSFDQLRALCFINVHNIPPINAQLCQSNYDNINSGYAKNGLLKTIKYPTGGLLTYSYDQNTIFTSTEGNKITGGVHVSSVSALADASNGSLSTPIVTTYHYVDPFTSNSSLWGSEVPNNVLNSTTYYKAEDTYYRFSYPDCITGCCAYHYSYPGIPNRGSSSTLVIPNVSFGEALKGFMIPLNTLVNIIQGDPIGWVLEAFDAVVASITSCIDGDGENTNITNSYSNQNYALANGLPLQFRSVEVIQGTDVNSPATGKEVHEFTSPADYPLWDANNDFSRKQRYAFWAYGLPKRTTILDHDNNRVRQTDYEFNWNNAKTVVSDPSCNCYVNSSSSAREANYFVSPTYASSSISGLQVTPYSLASGRVELTNVSEKSFRSSNQTQYLIANTHFDYNPVNFQVSKVTTTQSNGDQTRKEIYYPVDYSASSVLQAMVTNNIIATPVATYTSLQKAGTSTYQYLGADVTDYTVINGDIKASRKLVGRSSQPLGGFSFDPANAFNYPGLTELSSFTYDAGRNLTGIKDEGERQVVNIYDYDQKFIVASVINADPVIDKSCYSSFETNALGGWTLSGGDVVFDNSSITGQRSLVLDGYSIGTGQLNSTKTYKLSFWATSAATVSGSGTSLIASGPSINGFTYYEYEIAGTQPVSLSSNAGSPSKIDELRLYPKNARMRTVSYDPLIGKTSECDENNRITYYEYDNMGRIRFVKDEKGNVKKMFEYNTKQ